MDDVGRNPAKLQQLFERLVQRGFPVATTADPAFAAEANRQGLEVRPLAGAAIEKTVKRLFALDPKFIVQLRKLLFPEKPAADKKAP